MQVIKASGKREKFNKNKIINTITRAGANQEIAKQIGNKVEAISRKEPKTEISTRKILKTVLKELNKQPIVCARYNLKNSIMELGPTGFPFENFFAEILKNYGYQVKVGKIMQGTYITHEIDVDAKKDKRYLVECKFHNANGIYTGAKTALYIYARFLDLKKEFDTPWISTNTKCSRSVIKYSKGVGMKITSWNYGGRESLQNLIEHKRLYPITILRSVKGHTKDQLSKARIILAKDLLTINIHELKKRTHLPENILKKILKEAAMVCEFKENQN